MEDIIKMKAKKIIILRKGDTFGKNLMISLNKKEFKYALKNGSITIETDLQKILLVLEK